MLSNADIDGLKLIRKARSNLNRAKDVYTYGFENAVIDRSIDALDDLIERITAP